MRTKKIFWLMMIAPVAFGAPSPNQLNFDMSAKSRWSDNADKENKKLNIYTERQDEYSLKFDGTYNNEWIAANSLYDLSQLNFSENSQPNESLVTGKSDLVLGNRYQPFLLNIEHSNDVLLNAPDALDITTNRDERSALVVKPSFHKGFGDVDEFVASLSRTNIDFKKQQYRNLVTDRFETTYSHKFNAVDTVRLIGSSSKTDFDVNPLLNYKLESVLAEYSANLRKLQYLVAVGGNRILRDGVGVEFSSPQYMFNMSYVDAFNMLSLDFSQSLSDSSSDGLLRPNKDSADIDGKTPKLTQGVDVVKFTATTINWRSTYLCDRCTTSISLTKSTEDMLELNDDSSIRRVSASFSYKLSRFSSLDFISSASETNFDYLLRRGYNREIDFKISYKTKLMNHLRLDAFIARINAVTDKSDSDYIENLIGFKFDYNF